MALSRAPSVDLALLVFLPSSTTFNVHNLYPLTCASFKSDSSIFAFSLDSHICGGYLWVIVMVAITGAGAILSGSLERSRKLMDADGANNGAEGEVAALAFE